MFTLWVSQLKALEKRNLENFGRISIDIYILLFFRTFDETYMYLSVIDIKNVWTVSKGLRFKKFYRDSGMFELKNWVLFIPAFTYILQNQNI
jgi:hypothetical protein